METLHRIPDACARLGIGKSTLYELRQAGKIRFVKFAGRSLIPSSEIDRLIAELIAELA